MASGSLPTSPPLSINDINVAFYSASGTKTLSGLASDANISLPASVLDFLGCPYCKVYPDPNSLTWEYNNTSVKCSDILIIPYLDFKIYSIPSWASAAVDKVSCIIEMRPTTTNSFGTRSGRVCVCTCTGGYGTAYITMTQFSNQ